MKILAFDTSNKTLSVAILEDDRLLADITINIKKNHSVSLMPAIDFLMSSADLEPKDLDRIVVAQGPGSYTGLRVAVATAKMLAYSLSIELVGISSLYALASSVSKRYPNSVVIPLIDARRHNVYVGYYLDDASVAPDQHASFETVLEAAAAYDSVVFTGEVAAFIDDIQKALPQAMIQETLPSAYDIGLAGIHEIAQNIDAFVPNYLKRVEAEENWLKDHTPDQQSPYIKRV